MARRAFSTKQIYGMRKETFTLSPEWREAFGEPETCGTWFVWGQSGNGKSSFMMQLARELCLAGERVIYDSLEEGFSLSFQEQLRRHRMHEVNNSLRLVIEDMETLQRRLAKKRSPRVVVIDSLQYTDLDFGSYRALTEAFPRHLFIISCQARGNKPDGRSANRIMYDAMLKVWVEGYRAFSKGRFLGSRGYIDIWSEGATDYWGAHLKQRV